MIADCTRMVSIIDPKALAAHVIVALAEHQAKGRIAQLEVIADDIGVRRTDVRNVVSRLHAEGHVDARRLRLTFTGFALAAALDGCKLPEVRLQRFAPVQLRCA